MLRSLILIALFILTGPSGLYAQKILCISDYQGRGDKAATLERLFDTVFAQEGVIDTLVIAGDYIDADEVLAPFLKKFDSALDQRSPVVLFARGNHDGAASLRFDSSYPPAHSTQASLFHLPAKEPGQITAHQQNDILFIVTDPFLSFRRKGYTKRQLDQIEALLVRSTYTQTFVIGHMPAYPKFRHIGKSIDHFTHARDRLVEILARYDAHFIHGHDHYANLVQVDTSLHIGCGTINYAYGSAALIDTEAGGLDTRFYEVFMTDRQNPPPTDVQFPLRFNSSQRHQFQELGIGGWRDAPDLLWGSSQIPSSRQRFIEMGLMESSLEYLLDWINYFL